MILLTLPLTDQKLSLRDGSKFSMSFKTLFTPLPTRFTDTSTLLLLLALSVSVMVPESTVGAQPAELITQFRSKVSACTGATWIELQTMRAAPSDKSDVKDLFITPPLL